MPKRKAVKAPKAESLLIELLTEELPPKSLRRLSVAFAEAVTDYLKDKDFIDHNDFEEFATPRRLAVVVPRVLGKQLDRPVERKGPSVSAGLGVNGQPTQALMGFARSCGADVSKLGREPGDKGEYFVYRFDRKGAPLKDHLAPLVEEALKRLPVAKVMRWGAGNDRQQFVRPVHGVILLHGSKVVPGTVLGLKSGNRTLGHRFLSKGAVTIKRPEDYEKVLKSHGNVVVSFRQRHEMIVKELDKAAAKLAKGANWRLGKEMELVDEVVSIVESPYVYVGAFDESFLEVPRECLVVSMQQHQKYFPIVDARGKLLAKFLFVANMHPADARQIVHGNERVLRARLSDAKFFYDQDRKHRLDERVPRLANVVYQNKLGSQLERVQRLQMLAGHIAALLKTDAPAAERAAYLCKADLLTDMVGEFPELQGTMGRYYALHDGEPQEIADAIEQHYFPRTAGGELPAGPVALCISLADKFDTLVGIFGIGLAPTGEKDPFGLRRAAVGALRMQVEKTQPLDLKELIERARSHFKQASMAPNVVQQVQEFFFDRLRSYLKDKGYAADEIEAVLTLKPTHLDQVFLRLDAIKKFRALPEGMALAAANKRINNILRQAGEKITPALDGSLLQEDAEKELAKRLGEIIARVAPMVVRGDYTDALKELARLRTPVDAFFDGVMVMVEDKNLRLARLQLLAKIHHEFCQIADISRLQG